jgi:HAD superfamily hydrolase (TIGR01509 family)
MDKILLTGSPEKIRRNVSLAGLLSLFDDDKIVSATTVAHGKPAPDVYLEALKCTGCMDARKAIIIEDAVNGLKAAKGAGAYVVAVTNTLPFEVVAPHADRVVTCVADLDIATLTWPTGLS